jgi:hypothetical protein
VAGLSPFGSFRFRNITISSAGTGPPTQDENDAGSQKSDRAVTAAAKIGIDQAQI